MTPARKGADRKSKAGHGQNERNNSPIPECSLCGWRRTREWYHYGTSTDSHKSCQNHDCDAWIKSTSRAQAPPNLAFHRDAGGRRTNHIEACGRPEFTHASVSLSLLEMLSCPIVSEAFMLLAEKVAVITGGGRGIGRAIALKFAG